MLRLAHFAHVGALMLVGFVATHPADALQVVGKTRATLAWSAASGPVARYAVFESRNGAGYPSTPDQIVSGTTAVVQGQPGNTVRIRVAALDAQGRQGPLSPISQSIQFIAAETPPGGGGSSGGSGSSGGGSGGSGTTSPNEPDAVLGRIDLDDNGSPDLLFFEPDTGKLIAWLMDEGEKIDSKTIGRQRKSSLLPIEIADFDGDGQADVLWHDVKRRRSELWKLRGTRATVQTLPTGGSGWRLAGCADLTGDGVTDIVWSHENGRNNLWQLTRGARIDQTLQLDRAPEGYELAGTGDLDGDGQIDLVWQNDDELEWWKMNGITPAAISSLPSTGDGYQLASVADLDKDGRDDLVWNATSNLRRRSRGRGSYRHHFVVVWFSNGVKSPDQAVVAKSRSSYRISGLSDVDGNGVPEVAVQHSGRTWGVEVERRKVSIGSSSKRRILRWASNWNATDGRPASDWQVLAP
ncbi:MAG: hypothetical protein GY723_17475 [bacterium]|nr:hypothetical protein [bacterium]MCP5068600.1 hypothetical protein [bacterium]